MADKCRICLAHKKNVRSIYDTPDKGESSFANMMTSITKVKIEKDDGITDKICLACRKKLLEAYNFKLQIENSDAALQSSANRKKINFDNLYDIPVEVKNEVPDHQNNVFEYFKDGETSVFYNDTVIKRVEPNDTDIKQEGGSLSVIDFLNTIKNDDENECNDDDCDADYAAMSDTSDEEYLLPLSQRLKRKNAKNKKKLKSKSSTKFNQGDKFTPVHIKPVYLNDIRVLPTRNYDKPKVKKKYGPYVKPPSMCNICGKMSSTIKKHLLTHTGERSFKCDKCDKGFLTLKDLLTHEKLRHITERNFKCDKCIATFTNKEALKSHMLRHSDEKRFVCDVCSKGFKRKTALARHKLIHSVASKCIKCDLCNMTFISKYGLNHHLRIHTGERPYKCEICSQPYSYKHDFNRHCFKKHGVFLKRRSVNVMNEEVLKKERVLMRDLMLKINGFAKEGEPLNPFDGPQGYLAFEQAVRALQAKQIPIDYNAQ